MLVVSLSVQGQSDQAKTKTYYTLSLDIGSLSAGHCGVDDLKVTKK